MRKYATERGIPIDANVDEPVLVRERITPVDRRRFVEEANSSKTLEFSATEDAWTDAKAIPNDALLMLGAQWDDKPDTNVDKIINSSKFWPVVSEWLKKLPRNQRAGISNASGTALSQKGKDKFKNAMLAHVYGDSPETRMMLESFIEEDDQTKNLQNAIMNTLRSVGEVRGKIGARKLPADVDITPDIAVAVSKAIELKNDGRKVNEFLAQSSFAGGADELTPIQQDILESFDRFKLAPARMRDVIHRYMQHAQSERPPDQASFMADFDRNPRDLFNSVVQEVALEAEAARRRKNVEDVRAEFEATSAMGPANPMGLKRVGAFA